MRYAAALMMVFLFCSGCNASSDMGGNEKVTDDSPFVKSFSISIDDNKANMMVMATNDKKSIIYTAYVKHHNELETLKSKSELSAGHHPFRVFNYKGSEARYTLISLNSSDVNDDWYALCPYHGEIKPGAGCILSGKFNGYVFQTYVLDLSRFNEIVSAIKAQSAQQLR